MSVDLDLESIQRFMLAAISQEEGLEAGLKKAAALPTSAGLAAADLIRPSAELAAEQRLGIYADMYFWRLVDVLAEDYPRLRDFLGAEDFSRLARSYVHHHPSRHPNLSRLGERFPDFLRTCAEQVPKREIAVDLARLERSLSRVFDAEEDPAIAAEDLLGIEPKHWPELRLELISAHELVNVEHELSRWLDAGMPAATPPEGGPNTILVHRRDFELFRLELSPAQAACLQELAEGRPLLQALETTAEIAGLAADELAARVEGWFRTWTAIGLFRSIHR